ncbi:MAG: ABC transporter permease [Dehalococcoidales bacterium]|nr:MAG: ABC transporter permease [Dehalococcoidales bacterium]
MIIPTLTLVTIITFALVRFIPGDVMDMMVAELGGEGGVEFENVDSLRIALGLDEPIYTQYARWLGILPQKSGEYSGEFSGLLQGNLGNSLWDNEPVTDMIKKRLPVSIELGILSMLIGWSIALPIGMFMATRQDSLMDYSGRIFAIVMLSIPGFWLMTMVIVYPSIWWGAMPNIVYVPITENLLENLKQFLLPAFLTGAAGSALTMRLTRTMMLEVLRQDYIRTAWAKGLKERTVLMKHALKNAFIPIITVIGAQIPALLAGQIITETIFALPGMGIIFLEALNNRDYPVISAINTMIATAVLVMNVIVDITYAWFDPRIRYR